jgi:ribosome-associated translation inhibitor RaiA
MPIAKPNGARTTPLASIPLEVRTHGVELKRNMTPYVRAKLGARIGKFASRVEHVTVRFEDVNGPKGGVDTVCRVHVKLAGRPSEIVEGTSVDARSAFDEVSHVLEGTISRALERAGGGTRSRRGARREKGAGLEAAMPPATSKRRNSGANGGAGAKIPGGAPSKHARGTSGLGENEVFTGPANVLGAAPKATSAFETTASGKPSRKSTRAGANRQKPDTAKHTTVLSQLSSPQSRAQRGGAAKRR